jgi:Rrp44-like cold shock domain
VNHAVAVAAKVVIHAEEKEVEEVEEEGVEETEEEEEEEDSDIEAVLAKESMQKPPQPPTEVVREVRMNTPAAIMALRCARLTLRRTRTTLLGAVVDLLVAVGADDEVRECFLLPCPSPFYSAQLLRGGVVVLCWPCWPSVFFSVSALFGALAACSQPHVRALLSTSVSHQAISTKPHQAGMDRDTVATALPGAIPIAATVTAADAHNASLVSNTVNIFLKLHSSRYTTRTVVCVCVFCVFVFSFLTMWCVHSLTLSCVYFRCYCFWISRAISCAQRVVDYRVCLHAAPFFEQGIAEGRLFEGVMHINAKNRSRSYIRCPQFFADVMVDGLKHQNRALDGDRVVFEPLGLSHWKPLSQQDQSMVGVVCLRPGRVSE